MAMNQDCAPQYCIQTAGYGRIEGRCYRLVNRLLYFIVEREVEDLLDSSEPRKTRGRWRKELDDEPIEEQLRDCKTTPPDKKRGYEVLVVPKDRNAIITSSPW